LKINDIHIEIKSGETVLQAAMRNGIEIPNMCYYEEVEPFASCMLCVVKDKQTGSVFPSCSQQAQSDMDLISEDDELQEMRKASLELLLSDHVGDCEAPCTLTCPALLDIPLMNRLLADEKWDDALKIVRKSIALPGVLGRICSAPCEDACKRKNIDEPVSICLLKRYAADYGKMDEELPEIKEKKVAIIGAGPAGLAAAYYLRMEGYISTIFDKNEKAGGNLRYEVDDTKLPKEILDADIQWIKDVGVRIIQNRHISQDDFVGLQKEYDALIIALGDSEKDLSHWGMEMKGDYLLADKKSFGTHIPHVFAIGNVLRSSQFSIRALGHGRIVAKSVSQFLDGDQVIGIPRSFNSRFGFLVEEEFKEYLKEASSIPRNPMPIIESKGFSKEEMIVEAKRCMHCDCREVDNCKLRDYSDFFAAKQSKYSMGERKRIKKYFDHAKIVFEPEKCIKCGICVRITDKHKESPGLSYLGRGYDVEIGIPFDKPLDSALQKSEVELAKACPTGAISLK
jgi:ferredoxin